MFIQLHFLTSAPPSNLNRDDLGAPKTAQFGGEQRLRISSQCLKRAWRTSTIFTDRINGDMSCRTKRLGVSIFERLITNGVDEKKATKIAREVAAVFGKIKGEKDREPLLIEQVATISYAEMDAAYRLADRLAAGEEIKDKLADIVLDANPGASAVDVAMFGRMFANTPQFNGEAAVQVAHAITTHRVTVEDDFYTAVDDLNGHENTGAGHVGSGAGFGSGLFYLYACVNVDQLVENLNGDVELAKTAVAALIEAAATVAPGGKQASFASRTRASYVLAEKGDQQPRSLAEAFLAGVDPRDAFAQSKKRLTTQRDAFERAYGENLESEAMDIFDEDSGSLADVVSFACDWGV